MAHESNSPYVRWFVDKVEYLGDENFKIVGWIFHQTKEIKKILVGIEDIPFTPISRPDVESVYPFIVTQNVGFELTIKGSIGKKPISIILEDGSGINHIGNFTIPPIPVNFKSTDSVLYVKNSGFNNLHKGLVVVDNFYKDPDAIRDYAINNLNFAPSDYHKGQRSLDRFELEGTKETLESILGRKIYNWHHDAYANCRFQFCVDGDPIVYHCDNQMFAGIVFLSPDAPLDTGTATYQSKVTGARRYNSDEFGSDSFNKTFTGFGSEINFYDGSSFDTVDRVGNVYNRLVMWDAQTIHAATRYYGDNINNSRFFQLFFFDVE